MEHIDEFDSGKNIEVSRKLSTLVLVEDQNDFVMDFVKDFINGMSTLVAESDTKDIGDIGQELRKKYKASIFDVGGNPYEEFVKSMNKAKAVGIIVKDLEQLLPNQKAKYVMHVLMKISDDFGERYTFRFDGNGKVVSEAYQTHHKPKELEGDEEEYSSLLP